MLPNDLAVAPDGGTVYVTNGNSGNVALIDTAVNAVAATIALGAGTSPGGVTVAPNGSEIYVVCMGAVKVIDAATKTVGATIPVNTWLDVVATPDGTKLYVPDGANTVSVVDVASRAVVGTVSVTDGAGFAAITPNGAVLYLTSTRPNSNVVSVIDTAAKKVTTTIPV
jgi:YVTN family beta-propeller protein